MYNLGMPIVNKEDKRIPIIKKLFREILGYSEKEIQQFIDTKFMCIVVKNISLEQVKVIVKPFYDNDIQIYLKDINNKYLSYHEAGFHVDKETPKQHYYDTPVVSREHLVDPYTQQEKERLQNIEANRREQLEQQRPVTITCPYCKSTNTKKITVTQRAVKTGLFGIFGAIDDAGKTYKCGNCGCKF